MKKTILAGILSSALLLFTVTLMAQDVPGPSKNKSGKWGYTNKAGTVVIDYLFDAAQTFSENMAAVQKSGLWGYINLSGDIVIKCKYDDAWFFTDGLAAVKTYDKWGYINKKGEVVISSQFQDAAEFVDGLAWVKKDGLLGYINTSGETVIPFQYKAAVSFSNGYALAYKDTGWGVIDTKGTPMAGGSTFIFDDARTFSKSMAPVYSKTLGKWGLVGTDGKLKVDYAFDNPDIDRTTTAYGWAMAKASYQNEDKESLRKAVALIEAGYPSSYEKEKLLPYYQMLGEKEKIAEYRKSVRQAHKSSRSSSTTADFSVAVAPLKLAMYNAGKYSLKQIPLYGELRLGTVGIAARYNTYDQYHDRFRFSAMVHASPDSTLVYSGSEYSYMMKFFKKSNISKGYSGYGHSGQYAGFELRYSSLDCNTIMTQVFDENYTYFQNGDLIPITPRVKRYDASVIMGFSNSCKFFFWDIGMSFGLGLKQHDFGEEYGKPGYSYSDERLTDGWKPLYLVNRYYFRVGINLF